jgi:dTDP-4-amino-4,6-dideoxygalactose transaminase
VGQDNQKMPPKKSLNQYPFYNSDNICFKAENFIKNTIMIPCHQYLEKEELERIAEALV